MNGRKIAVTPSAYSYPLLIKQLLHAPLAQTARQEIVYRDVRRLTYFELRDRIGRPRYCHPESGYGFAINCWPPPSQQVE